MFSSLQKRWGLESTGQTMAVLLVFSLAGFSILPARRWVFEHLGIGAETPIWIKMLTWLLVVFPAYQIFLLLYGALFGQLAFFWEKEKRLWRWLMRPFRPKSATVIVESERGRGITARDTDAPGRMEAVDGYNRHTLKAELRRSGGMADALDSKSSTL